MVCNMKSKVITENRALDPNLAVVEATLTVETNKASVLLRF